MSVDKRLSVIIPGYNTPGGWWMRCINSVLKAVGKQDEVIVVDDGSLEGFKLQALRSKLNDDRIKFVYKENGGLGSARNAGLEIAQGEYVTFVDSDDEVLSEAFEEIIARIVETSSDVGLYGVRTIWVKERLMKEDSLARISLNLDGRELTPEDILSLSRGCLMNYAWNKVYRRQFLCENRIVFDKDGMPCEDIIFNLECVIAGAKWCGVDYIGYVYYRTGSTLLSCYKPTNHLGYLRCTEAWKRYKAHVGRAREILGDFGEWTSNVLAEADWRNVWMKGSPLSLRKRWAVRSGLPFFKMFIYSILRRYCYFRPIRRWNVKRQYPYAKETNNR